MRVLLLLLALSQASQSQKQPQTERDTPAVVPQAIPPAATPRRTRVPEAAPTQGKDQDKPSERDMVWLTIGLLIIAGIQAVYFIRQLNIMRASLKDAKDNAEAAKLAARAAQADSETTKMAFIAANRPRLKVRNAYISDPGGDGGWLQPGDHGIYFTIVNSGESMAKLVEMRLTHRLVGKVDRLPGVGHVGQPKDLPATVIEPGAGVVAHYDFDDKQRTGWLQGTEPFAHASYNFYFIGEIVYEDANGVRRRMGFCRSHNRRFKRFDAAEDEPDYEYGD